MIPPLRNRREDVLLLASEFVGKVHQFTDEAVTSMLEHTWPGNVRELKQRVQSAVAMSESEMITPVDLGLTRMTAGREESLSFERYFELPLAEAHQLMIADFDREAVGRALEKEAGNISAAARRLGMHRQSLQQKMKQLGIRSMSE